MARWKLLVQRQLWWVRKDTVNKIWTSYRRSLEEARLEAEHHDDEHHDEHDEHHEDDKKK